MFARWGRIVYRHRWVTLVVSAVLLGLSIGGIASGGTLVGTSGGFGAQLLAGQANKLITDEIHPPQQQEAAGSSMTLLFSSGTMTATDADFKAELESALAPLAGDARVVSVTTPYSVPAADETNLISRDSHQALVVVNLKDRTGKAQGYYRSVLAEIHPGSLRMVATGQVPLNDAFNSTLEADLRTAEFIALPVTLLMLVLIFASIVAAALPLSVGLLAIVGGVGGTLTLARYTDVSQYAINVVTLIGLAIAIDYSLFIVNRFREGLAAGMSREDAISLSMATAGRAITFSGVTVAIGLSAMLFYQGTYLASMGAAGGIVVAVAVAYALTFLPALLSVIGGGVDRLRLPFLGRARPEGTGPWHSMAMWVMRRPFVVLVPALAALLLAGTPFLQLHLANSDVDALPPSNPARQGYDTLLRDFPGQDQTTIEAVVYYADSSPLTSDHVGAIYDLSRRLGVLPGVLSVQSIVDVDPAITRAQYEQLYEKPAQLPSRLQAAMQLTTGQHIAVLYITTNQQYTSDAARDLVRDIRAESVPGGQVLATGETAFDLDIVNFIVSRTPTAVGVVVLVTYLVLFLLTGSVVLPLKAVITNLFSISASFGALVFIFQQGHFSSTLGFTPQSIDPSIPVILFSIVFGMSMDYEVLLISRIQEEYKRTGDNQRGVALGLEKSGRLITGAAASGGAAQAAGLGGDVGGGRAAGSGAGRGLTARAAAALAAMLIVCSCASSSAGAPSTTPAQSDWPMFRGDLQRDGHTAGATLTAQRAASLHPVWTATPGGAIDGTPVVVGRTVITGTESGMLAAFDLRTGAQAWITGGLGKITASPAVAKGIAVVGSTNGHVYGVRVSDGHRIWDWKAPGDQPAVWSSPAITGDIVVIGVASPYGDSPPAQGSVAALQLQTGRQIWEVRGDGAGVWSSFAIDGAGHGFVGVGNPDDGMMAISIATGQVLWSVSFHPDAGRDLDVGATPVIGSLAGREVVGVGSDGGVFELLDAATGAALWTRFVVPGSAVHGLIASPAFDGTLLYVPSASPPMGMNALDPTTGDYRWQQLTELPIYSAPALGSGVIVFGTGDAFGDPHAGKMIALSTTDGSVVWSYDMKSSVFSAPAIAGDEVLVGDTEGALTVFGPD